MDALQRAETLWREGQHEEALVAYRQAIVLDPGRVDAHVLLGNRLKQLGRAAEALPCFDTAAQLRPQEAGIHYNRALVLQAMGQHREALAAFDRAIGLRPDLVNAHYSKGRLLCELGHFDLALPCYDRALALDDSHAEAHLNRSFCHLLRGDFRRGLPEYEWRHRQPGRPARPWPRAAWTGSPALKDRLLLVHAEQGFGDSLQFCRYVPMLAASGVRVILQVPEPLRVLMQSLRGVEQLCVPGQGLPAVHAHIPMLSLPLACGTEETTIPRDVPYLHVDPVRSAQWNRWLGPRTGRMRIGIAWSGSPTHRSDAERSLPLAALAAAAFPADLEYIHVQPDPMPESAAGIRFLPNLRVPGDDLRSFAETAALIDQLDLVITVDTAVAHLAGALGKPVWILLAFVPDWRWMLGRSDSPWYPTARLFRQGVRGDWNGLLTEVRQALVEVQPSPPSPPG